MKIATAVLASLLFCHTLAAQSVTEPCTAPDPGDLQPLVSVGSLGYSVTVPVFFHVIQDAAGYPAVSSSLIADQIDVLNSRFGSNSSASRVYFRLAGVSYTSNPNWVRNSLDFGSGDASDLKGHLNIDPAHVLNVYVTDADGNNWSTFPQGIEVGSGLPESSTQGGIILSAETMPGQGGKLCSP